MKALGNRIPRSAVLVALLALVLYLPGFWWGSPYATAPDRKHSWGVDDETPLGPLTEIHNIFTPKPNQNLGYPLMYSFVVSAAYSPYIGYLFVTGKLTSVSGTFPFGLVDPVGSLRDLSLIAHLVSVLMGVGIVVAAYAAGSTLWDRRTGILSGVFAMVAFPMFYYTRTGNVDVPVLFFTAVALAVFARVLIRGMSVRRGAWLGTFVGLALATKEPSLASFLAFPVVLLLVQHRKHGRSAWLTSTFWRAPLITSIMAVLAFGFGSGLFVDPGRYWAHVQFVAQRAEMMRAGLINFQRSFPYSMDGHRDLALLIGEYLIDSMTIPGLVLALLGVIWTVRRESWTAIFALPALTYMLVLFLFGRAAQLRYMMPIVFTFSCFAARFVVVCWESNHRLARVAVLLLAAAGIGLNVLRGGDLTYAMINDSRYAAAAWLEKRTEPGDVVEYFGYTDHLPPLESGVITQAAIEFQGVMQGPRNDEAAVEDVRQRWKEKRAPIVVIVPDFTSPPGVPHSGSCPPKVYEGLHDGSLGYRLAAFFQTPSLVPWVMRPALDYPVVNPPIHIFVPAEEETG